MKELTGSRLFVIAIVCGLIAAGLTVFYMQEIENKYRKASQPKKEVKVSVVVSRGDMAKGDRVNGKLMASLKVPEKYLPSNVVLAKDYKKLVNRTLLLPIQKGRPITWDAVTGTSAATFSEVIDLGRRAKSIKVNTIDSFDGLLRPGDVIDLMGNFSLADLGVDASLSNPNINSLNKDKVSDDVVMPVLERVEVLEASRVDKNGTRYEMKKAKNSVDGFNMDFALITLNLTPKQIARVEMAKSTGSVFAVLRHPKDTSLAGYDYLGVDMLLQKDSPEAVDLVLDENGNPIGRIVGDNIVDENGKIIGKVVDGQAVTFDGKVMGKIVKNVSADDPINRVAEVADVVRDANGNVIGKIVDGKIVDENGNVIGEVKNGQAVGLDGESLGSIQRGASLDKNGNIVDVSKSSVASAKTRREQVVRDADGNIVGRVVNGQVLDASGNVIGRVDESGRAVGLDGRSLGKTEEVLVDGSGKVVGQEAQIVRDANGNVIGRVVDGQIVDADGNVVGTVGEDGVARSLDGEELGQVETAMLNENGEVMGLVSEVVRDANGNVIGRVVNGKVLDADGNVVGYVDEDGTVLGLDGQVLGTVEKVVLDADGRPLDKAVEVVRDANGNIIGTLVDGKVIDQNGNVLGELVNGQLIDADGNVLASGLTVSSESASAVAAERLAADRSRITHSVIVVDFIAGGKSKDGITPVQKVRME